MPKQIRLTSEELGLMSLFHGVSGATARDCVIDGKMNRVIFVVSRQEMGLAIGRKGATVQNLEKLIGKPVELVEYSEDAGEFIKRALNEKYVQEVRIIQRLDGSRTAVVVVEQRHRGAVLGRAGRNAEKVRLMVRRYFDIPEVQFVSAV